MPPLRGIRILESLLSVVQARRSCTYKKEDLIGVLIPEALEERHQDDLQIEGD